MNGVSRQIDALRRRAVSLVLFRALVMAGGAGALASAVVAWSAGPVISLPAAVGAWALLLAVLVVAFAFGARDGLRLRGTGATTLLGRAGLASRARSVLELSPSTSTSPSLVLALGARVQRELDELEPREIVPARSVVTRPFLVALAALPLVGLVFFLDGRAVSGAWALAHPARRDAMGVPLASAVAHVRVRIVPPSYTGEPPSELVDPVVVRAPAGATIEVHVSPRLAAREGTLALGDTHAALAREADGSLVGRVVAREGGPLAITLATDAGRVRDGTSRRVVLVPDRAPFVVVAAPSGDELVEDGEDVVVAWTARDDHGLASVELVIRAPDGHEVRRRLADGPSGRAQLVASGSAMVSPRALGARPGDAIVLRVEARDRDTVSGPNVGRSASRTITVASEASHRALAVQQLAELRDATVDALAGRLEWTVPEPPAEAVRRQRALAAPESAVQGGLGEAGAELRARHQPRDGRVLAGMAAQLLGLLDRERALHGSRPAPRARRVEADGALVTALEADALLLDDMVGRARLEDAAAIVRELVAARHQIAALIAELRRAPTEEARQALRAELARAEQRLAELAGRLAQMGTDVPSDFANQAELSPAAAQNELTSLQDAVAHGDLDAAQARLDALGRQLEQLAGSLGAAGDHFAEARFGERDRALGEALDRLAGLESEQRALADRSADVQRRAAERAEQSGGAADRAHANELAGHARELRRAASRIDAHRLGSAETHQLDDVRQRLDDVAAALESGDVAEAQGMARRASEEAQALAEDVEIEAQMFGDGTGRSPSVRAARDVAHRSAELSRAIAAATPAGLPVTSDERRAMQDDVPRQRHVATSAGGVADALAHGPDGAPLSAEGEQAVREAVRSMGDAAGALGHGDARDAARLQDEAARKLRDLREQLEHDRQSGGESSGQDNGDESDGSIDAMAHEPVVIPGADSAHGPEERRRHVLDAMRDQAPTGFEAAVRRYYEEVLR